jgi:succinate dehydrogenase/fumarate reductase flavoprotein subunit
MSTLHNDISRQPFMGHTESNAGASAHASMGASDWAKNKSNEAVEKLSYQESETDVLVIGGGMAGLFAAVKAHDAGSKVMLISKGRLGASGQTPFAKGMFIYDPETSKVSVDEFVDSVSRSSMGTSNKTYTRQMVENSKARIDELREWGFFESTLYNKAFRKPINERNIDISERIVITHLIKENGRIAGAAGFCLDEGKVMLYHAKSVILCTGAGGFKPNGFPICDLTHDGTIMTYNIGAKVTGKEWNDGHHGQSINPADCFNGWHGMFERMPGLTGVKIRHDLGVDFNYKAYKTGNPIQLTNSEINTPIITAGPYIPEEYRNIAPPGSEDNEGPKSQKSAQSAMSDGKTSRNDQERDKDPEHRKGGHPPMWAGNLTGGASAGLSIHKSEGLVPVNDKCESMIPGLFAAGDALGSYMSGAIYTQIGSSLTGSAVQGSVAGEASAEYCKKINCSTISKEKTDKIYQEILAPLKRESGYSPAWLTQLIQGIMIPNFIIYIKKEKLLRAALAYIEELRDHHLPLIRAADMHELRLAHETANMIITAEMKLRASIMRTESRCSHYRLDYPELDNENWQAWINIFKGSDGSMQFEKQAFGTWPV